MSESQHILSRFDRELNLLNQGLFAMADLASQNLSHAMEGLLHRDIARCNQVIAEDESVDALEKKIDADGVQILTKFSPLAKDLRWVISTMKVSNNLERISDQSVNIARRAKRLAASEKLEEVEGLQKLYKMAHELLHEALKAFRYQDIAAAQTLKSKDKGLDLLQTQFIEKTTVKMMSDPVHAKDYMDLIFIARFLERVGDHAVNIGEDAVYTVSAEDIRHSSNRVSSTSS